MLNMPTNSFLFYVFFHIVQIFAVIIYGAYWYLKDKKLEAKGDR